MSDNISGTTIAADEVVDPTLGTAKVQYVKLMDGALDGTTKAGVGANGLKVDASGAAVPVTDNGGSLTVDNAGTFAVRLTDGAGNALTSAARGAERALSVQVVDGSGAQVTSFGGGGSTTSNFSSAFPASGTAVGAKDSTGANMVPLNLDASGNLKVNVAAGGASGGTSSSFAAAFPGSGTAIGAKNGSNMVSVAADASGNLQVNLQTAIPGGTNVIGSVKTTDGTNTAAVKAASTAPLAADPALVVAISPNSINPNGQKTMSSSAPIVIASDQSAVPVSNAVLTKFGAGEYETVAASQTAQALGATGAIGDYISGILVVPASTSPGSVTLLDGSTSITVFAGGASSLSNLVPFFIPLGMISVSGAWKITTGAGVSCIGIGDFT